VSAAGDSDPRVTDPRLANPSRHDPSGAVSPTAAPAARPITVSGTFVRPALSLTFDGMVYEGRPVRGSVRSAYTSVGGIADTLVLTGESYTKKLVVLLQER